MGHLIFIVLWGMISRFLTTEEEMHRMMCDEAEEMYREGRI